MNKPSNWYAMDADERRAWERQARAVEDLEYEKEREREGREWAFQRADEVKRQAAAARSAHEEERAGLLDEIDGLRDAAAELALAKQFLKEKGLASEFDDWASYRREE
jgi:hypothetical protein